MKDMYMYANDLLKLHGQTFGGITIEVKVEGKVTEATLVQDDVKVAHMKFTNTFAPDGTPLVMQDYGHMPSFGTLPKPQETILVSCKALQITAVTEALTRSGQAVLNSKGNKVSYVTEEQRKRNVLAVGDDIKVIFPHVAEHGVDIYDGNMWLYGKDGVKTDFTNLQMLVRNQVSLYEAAMVGKMLDLDVPVVELIQ